MSKLKYPLILGSLSLLSLAVLSNSGCCSSDSNSTCEGEAKAGVTQDAPLNASEIVAEATVEIKTVSVIPELAKVELLDLIPLAIANNLVNEVATFNGAIANGEQLNSLYAELNEKEEISNELLKNLSDLAVAFYNNSNFDIALAQSNIEARVKENIALKTILLYLDTAKSQKKCETIANVVNECQTRYALIEKLQKSRQITPFVADVEKERTKEILVSLDVAIAEYKANSDKLIAYTNYVTETSPIVVNNQILDLKVVNKEFLNKELAQLALLEREELVALNNLGIIDYDDYSSLITKNITVVESIKKLLGDKFSTTQYKSYFTPETVEFEKRLPIVDNLIANINYFNAQMATEKDNFIDADKKLSSNEAKLNRAISTTTSKSELAKLELDNLRFASLDAEITKLDALVKFYKAYAYVLNTVGAEEIIVNMPMNVLTNISDEYSNALGKFPKAETATPATTKAQKATIRISEIDFINAAK